jgi:cytochrome c peroxidase
VAPILSPDEMSASGRDATDIANKIIKHRGKKLSLTRPLGFQRVDPEDSVLGSMSRWPLPGLSAENYEALIRKAFRKEWWDSKHALKVADDGSVRVLQNRKPSRDDEYTLMEYNFGLFFGIALQLYQATLVSDDTPYDRWRRGDPGATISEQALLGLQVFVSQDRDIRDGDGNIIQRIRGGRCVNCHSGAELTDASVTAVKAGTVRRNRNHVDSNGITLDVQDLDRGFNNIGVRPTTEDLGVGGVDKFGKPLSAVALCRQHPAQPQPPAPCPPTGTAYLAVEGAFKAPGLRNVELTAPYFHNGGHLTLESVIEFYSRGGDLGPVLATDGTREIAPLSIPSLDGAHVGLTQAERDALVAFLKTLTDERVRNRKAPFDHPDLFIPHGQLDDNLTARRDPLRPGQAMDRVRLIQAVGRSGGAPLPQFLQLQ